MSDIRQTLLGPNGVGVERFAEFHNTKSAENARLPAGRLRGRVSHRELGNLQRPFPAFSAADRLHLEIFGYVVVHNVLTRPEIDELVATAYALEARYHSGEVEGVEPAFFECATRDYFRVNNIAHLAPSLFDYLTHPRIVGMAEEAIGGGVRLVQSDLHIRRPVHGPSTVPGTTAPSGFHSGASMGYDSRTAGGLYHFPFVKALTNLSDLGPEDGGTRVIPGTHKLTDDAVREASIEAAIADADRLVHSVVAPAGSTLLFYESLLHSGGTITSDRDRPLIIGGYVPSMMAPFAGYEPSPSLLAQIPASYRDLFTGGENYFWRPRARDLRTPIETVGEIG